MEESRQSLVPGFKTPPDNPQASERVLQQVRYILDKALEPRYVSTRNFENRIQAFQKRTATQHQLANKLHQATKHAVAKNRSLDNALEDLTLNSSVENGPPSSD